MTSKSLYLPTILFALVAAGCGSSGSGGGTSTPDTVQFTSFADAELVPGEELVLPAVSLESTYDAENGLIFSEASGAATGASFSYLGGEDPDGEPAKFTVTSAEGTVIEFKPSDEPGVFMARIVETGVDTGYSDGSPFMLDFTDPEASETIDILLGSDFDVTGWDYQQFGVWVTGFGEDASGTVGAASGGAFTAGTDIPQTGSATFTGVSTGVYAAPDGAGFITASNMTAVASFANRSVNFSTTDTRVAPADTIGNIIGNTRYSFAANNGLDLNGTMNYAAGSNNLRGEVAAENGMTGSVNGNFYGPSANEIGGTFAVDGDQGSYIGGFGGKR